MKPYTWLAVALALILLTPNYLWASRLHPSPLSGKRHEGLQYQTNVLSLAQIINADFDQANFRLNQWSLFSFKNVTWRKSLLNGVNAVSTDFSRVEFLETDLSGFKCNRCVLENIIFDGSRLDGARFFSSTFKNVHFRKSDLSRADIIFTQVENCILDAATAQTVKPEKIKRWGCTVRNTPR